MSISRSCRIHAAAEGDARWAWRHERPGTGGGEFRRW